jgi:4-aminobutyrate aminotransferase
MMTTITSKTQKLIDRENEIMSFTTRVPYYPLVVEEAKGVKIKDIEGNEFIDFLASAAVINTGHNHPRIVKRIQDQLNKFIHYTPAYMYHQPHLKLAEEIIRITPGTYDKRVAFGLSGSSSVDGAIKAACSYTKRSRIISFFRSYHGTTIGSISVSGYSPSMKRNLGALMSDVDFIPYPDSYRGKYNLENDDNGRGYIEYLENLFNTVVPADEVAAIIYEPIQGDAGVLIPPKNFFCELRKICDRYGILMIADEVQTGFGRTGKMFASEHFDIEPDILIFGKAVASGMPLSGLVARKEIFESWGTPAHFFNTAGNPLSCVASLETIAVVEEENLLENATLRGNEIIAFFNELKEKYDCIGDVRGAGLLVGVDIVKDLKTKERDVNKTAKICWRCWEKGLILAFFSESVLRIAPPLVITKEETERALKIIQESIQDVEMGRVPDSVLEAIKGW